jgi:hypothetical protein
MTIELTSPSGGVNKTKATTIGDAIVRGGRRPLYRMPDRYGRMGNEERDVLGGLGKERREEKREGKTG